MSYSGRLVIQFYLPGNNCKTRIRSIINVSGHAAGLQICNCRAKLEAVAAPSQVNPFAVTSDTARAPSSFLDSVVTTKFGYNSLLAQVSAMKNSLFYTTGENVLNINQFFKSNILAGCGGVDGGGIASYTILQTWSALDF